MATFKEFLGLNYCIYDPCLTDDGRLAGLYRPRNTIGYINDPTLSASPLNKTYSDPIDGLNSNITPMVAHDKKSTLVLLNLHRNGPYGYPSWKQLRVSENHLTRSQKKKNIFTYQTEIYYFPFSTFSSGQYIIPDVPIDQSGDISSNLSLGGVTPFLIGPLKTKIRQFTEPSITDSFKPMSLIGDVALYNSDTSEFENRTGEIKTSFGNDIVFFGNEEINDNLGTKSETSSNYEDLKELYLNGGLEDDGSPFESFRLMIYRQSIYPKQKHLFLQQTRTREEIDRFWRDNREDRQKYNVDNGIEVSIPRQSSWPLDHPLDFIYDSKPEVTFFDVNGVFYSYYPYRIGGELGSDRPDYARLEGYNTGPDDSKGGSGYLLNSYSHLTVGYYDDNYDPQMNPELNIQNNGFVAYEDFLTASAFYSRRHTYDGPSSMVAPSGMEISEVPSGYAQIPVDELFEGNAYWSAPEQAGKSPAFDSIDDFSIDTRLKGKSYSVVPEFKISSRLYNPDETEEVFMETVALFSTTEFLKNFDLVKKDHQDFASDSILTLRCKAIKKFIAYDGFYPAQQTVEIAKDFMKSIKGNITSTIAGASSNGAGDLINIPMQSIIEPMFAPGILFNTIKSGVAVDYPIITAEDDPQFYNVNVDGLYKTDEGADKSSRVNYFLAGSKNYKFEPNEGESLEWNILNSIWSKRIDFEALVEPERFLSNIELMLQEPHPFGMRGASVRGSWDGKQNPSYKSRINNFLSEVGELFLENKNFTTLASAEEQSPSFGNAISGNYYTMRIKMYGSTNKSSQGYESWDGQVVNPPQNLYNQGVSETLTMYSRPSAFGIGLWGGKRGGPDNEDPISLLHGQDYCFTPPYYNGESWCDLIFCPTETRKYTVDEIIASSSQYPYYTRFWHPGIQDALRDLTGYSGSTHGASDKQVYGKYSNYSNSPWAKLLDESALSEENPLLIFGNTTAIDNPDHWGEMDPDVEDQFGGVGLDILYWPSPSSSYHYNYDQSLVSPPPQHPSVLNYNAMQLDSSVNLFGKGTIKKDLDYDDSLLEVASSETVKGKTRWIIQTKFETPILNFNKYSNLEETNSKPPPWAEVTVPRGMWHQYGEIPEDEKGVFLQVGDIPSSWLKGALGISTKTYKNKVRSLADLVGFSKEAQRLGKIAETKQISEAVVAIPFVTDGSERKMFSIPREDIDSCIEAMKREVEPNTFVAGGPPKAGDSVYQMVKKMKKYVFPKILDFVENEDIQPFAAYIFEFTHNLGKKDLSDIWQNLSPDIGTRMEEAEATISHELLSHELLGKGSVIENGELNTNVAGDGIPSNIEWMVFKVKKRAKTNYYDKIVQRKGTTEDTSTIQLENAVGNIGNKTEVVHNWPYDFFSLVELVKIDAEVGFAQTKSDEKGQRVIEKIDKKSQVEIDESKSKSKQVNIARGKGRIKK